MLRQTKRNVVDCHRGVDQLGLVATNLTWTPTAFEDKEINVHQGAYACAQRMYDRVEKLCKNHLKTFGSKKARIKLTGHSIGGSLAHVLGLMPILRNGVPRLRARRYLDVWIAVRL